jgi:hypothetical protein
VGLMTCCSRDSPKENSPGSRLVTLQSDGCRIHPSEKGNDMAIGSVLKSLHSRRCHRSGALRTPNATPISEPKRQKPKVIYFVLHTLLVGAV